MFGSSVLDRRIKPARIADQTWERLVSPAGSAGRKARRRAGRAYQALAGRRSGPSWGWLVGAGLGGVALGWTVAMAVTRTQRRLEAVQAATGSVPVLEDAPTVEFVDVNPPIR